MGAGPRRRFAGRAALAGFCRSWRCPLAHLVGAPAFCWCPALLRFSTGGGRGERGNPFSPPTPAALWCLLPIVGTGSRGRAMVRWFSCFGRESLFCAWFGFKHRPSGSGPRARLVFWRRRLPSCLPPFLPCLLDRPAGLLCRFRSARSTCELPGPSLRTRQRSSFVCCAVSGPPWPGGLCERLLVGAGLVSRRRVGWGGEAAADLLGLARAGVWVRVGATESSCGWVLLCPCGNRATRLAACPSSQQRVPGGPSLGLAS